MSADNFCTFRRSANEGLEACQCLSFQDVVETKIFFLYFTKIVFFLNALKLLDDRQSVNCHQMVEGGFEFHQAN